MEFGERTRRNPGLAGLEFGERNGLKPDTAGSELREKRGPNPSSAGLEFREKTGPNPGLEFGLGVWRRAQAEPWFGRFEVRRKEG